MIPMNDRKFLITTDATEETWKNMMNDVMSNDQKTAANKLKWKPSKKWKENHRHSLEYFIGSRGGQETGQ